MPHDLASLDGRRFDVAVIGAGINGASAAQHLAAAGYDVLIADKGDFGAGSTSRSSRLLHCGLRYLAPGNSMWDFVRHPGRLAVALRMARLGMEARSQMVATTPERTVPMTFCFPIYRGGPYSGWQVDLAFRVLWGLGPKDLPLDYRRLSKSEALSRPLLRWLRDDGDLDGVATFREYRMDWPERLCLDSVLDAERLGAVVLNYTTAHLARREADGEWLVELADAESSERRASVRAKLVLNMAGVWIDRVNEAAATTSRRYITGTKGAHVMIRLPPECRDVGIATINRLNEPFYLVPWRGMHYIGPTETLYEGDVDDVRPTEEEIEFLIAEARHMLPGLALERRDVLFAWAGVRPLTHDEREPKGKRSRVVHDLAEAGFPGVLAMTGGVIMTSRSGGAEMVAAVARRMKPSRPARPISFATRKWPENQNSPPLLEDDGEIKLADLRFAAQHEHPRHLHDLLFGRVGVGWSPTMGRDAARRAAETVADIVGWSPAEIEREVAAYRRTLAERHLLQSPAR